MALCHLPEVDPCVVRQILTATPWLALSQALELLGCGTLICWVPQDVLGL